MFEGEREGRSRSSMGGSSTTPTGGQKLAERFLSERRGREIFRVESPEGSVEGSPAFI